jgi:hypothetical protein
MSNGWTLESALENEHIHGTRRFLSEHQFFSREINGADYYSAVPIS